MAADISRGNLYSFYLTIMTGDSPLSRAQHELLATVVSAENHCHY